MHNEAFQGSEARKKQMIEPLRAKWSAGQILPLSYLKWRTDGGIVSISGALAETQDSQVFVERTGIPIELATLCEGLVYAGLEFRDDESAPMGFTKHGSDAILSFGLEWLDAIPVGHDLSDVAPRFMKQFLRHVLGPDFALAAQIELPVRMSAERILALWDRELSGETVAAKEWRALRTEALHASEASSATWGYAAAELVESLAWPLRGLASEFVPILQLFVQSWMQFVAFPYLSNKDQKDQISALIALRELGRAQRDAILSQEPSETLLDRLPESKRALLATMQPEVKARMDAARRQARTKTDALLRAQMDTLIGLIQQSAAPTQRANPGNEPSGPTR
jgi:hypothetical protein